MLINSSSFPVLFDLNFFRLISMVMFVSMRRPISRVELPFVFFNLFIKKIAIVIGKGENKASLSPSSAKPGSASSSPGLDNFLTSSTWFI